MSIALRYGKMTDRAEDNEPSTAGRRRRRAFRAWELIATDDVKTCGRPARSKVKLQADAIARPWLPPGASTQRTGRLATHTGPGTARTVSSQRTDAPQATFAPSTACAQRRIQAGPSRRALTAWRVPLPCRDRHSPRSRAPTRMTCRCAAHRPDEKAVDGGLPRAARYSGRPDQEETTEDPSPARRTTKRAARA